LSRGSSLGSLLVEMRLGAEKGDDDKDQT